MIVLTPVRAPTHAAEDKEVEEVHAAQDQQYHADLDRQRLNTFLRRGDLVTEFQRETDVTKVDQVKTDDEQVIDRVGETFVAVEDVYEKDASVFMERARDPDGERDADSKVNEVGGDSDCHVGPPRAKFEHVQLAAAYASSRHLSRSFFERVQFAGTAMLDGRTRRLGEGRRAMRSGSPCPLASLSPRLRVSASPRPGFLYCVFPCAVCYCATSLNVPGSLLKEKLIGSRRPYSGGGRYHR